jgi:hypothetical protein
MRLSVTKWVRVARIFFAALAVIALIAQLMQSIGAGRSTVNFFSYFTIQSNVIAVAVLLWVALKSDSVGERMLRDMIRGAPVLYLSVTGIVFAVLLSDLPLVTVPFANTVLHKLMPVVVVMDWIIDPPSPGVSFRKALVWMVYPLGWLAYTMVRGYLIGWYPYPFLNPAKMGGYGNVLGIILMILSGGVLFIWLIVWIGQLARRYSRPGDS